MAEQTGSAAETNKEFLDSFLEFGIGHYFTLAKFLSNRVSEDLTDAERMSIGIEISALAGASLESLVAWFHALRWWSVQGSQHLLVEVLSGIRVGDAERLNVLSQTRDSRADEFCHIFRIPWNREELRSRRIDETNWRYTVDQAKLNITKVLEDLSPYSVKTPQAWVLRYLNTVSHGFHPGAGGKVMVPTVSVATGGTEAAAELDQSQITIPTEAQLIDQLADLTGNAAIGLFLLIRLLYISAFGRDPRSLAFVMIWQELRPAKGEGA